MRTRIAPTPSGYLHLGNCANALLISEYARASGGTVALRIDDADAGRMRPEYLEDIFGSLEWLGITWTEGPRDAADQPERFSQALRTAEYREQLDALRAGGAQLFACRCSRTELVDGCCVRGCAEAELPLEPEITVLRLRLPAEERVQMSGTSVSLRAEHGDPVLWRRDDLPAYHLVTVAEDRRSRMTHVIRGEDLLASSALHAYLGAVLGDGDTAPCYLHHPLLRDEHGEKLSKSVLSAAGTSNPLAHDAENLEFVRASAKGLLAELR